MKLKITKRTEVNGKLFDPGTYELTNELAAKIIKQNVKQIKRRKYGSNNRNNKRN